jgi:hypothetical protein
MNRNTHYSHVTNPDRPHTQPSQVNKNTHVPQVTHAHHPHTPLNDALDLHSDNVSFESILQRLKDSSNSTLKITDLPPLPPPGVDPLQPKYGWITFPADAYGIGAEVAQMQRIHIARLIVRLTEKVSYFL